MAKNKNLYRATIDGKNIVSFDNIKDTKAAKPIAYIAATAVKDGVAIAVCFTSVKKQTSTACDTIYKMYTQVFEAVAFVSNSGVISITEDDYGTVNRNLEFRIDVPYTDSKKPLKKASVDVMLKEFGKWLEEHEEKPTKPAKPVKSTGGTTPPSGGSGSSTGGTSTPSSGTASGSTAPGSTGTPSGGTTPPSGGSSASTGGSGASSGGTTPPSGGSSTPTGTGTSTGGTTPPSGGSSAPTGSTSTRKPASEYATYHDFRIACGGTLTPEDEEEWVRAVFGD